VNSFIKGNQQSYFGTTVRKEKCKVEEQEENISAEN